VSHFASHHSSTASLTLSRSDSTISVVSGLPLATDSEPFPAFDPGYLPDPIPTIDDFPHVRDSCQTIDYFVSVGVAVSMKLPASSSPSSVHNGRREFIEAGLTTRLFLAVKMMSRCGITILQGGTIAHTKPVAHNRLNGTIWLHRQSISLSLG
jgi:hypothetical protein